MAKHSGICDGCKESCRMLLHAEVVDVDDDGERTPAIGWYCQFCIMGFQGRDQQERRQRPANRRREAQS